MKTALTIAGSDCSGGAGIQADLKTMTLNGVYAMSVITALTAQNTTGVSGILGVDPEFLKKQLDAVFQDIFPDAVKIGMMYSEELVLAAEDRLRFYGAQNIVVDPVMVSTAGSSLINEKGEGELAKRLFPLSRLVTPNIPEAEVLTGMDICSKEAQKKAAEQLGKEYGCAVLLKGGHSPENADDLLYNNGEFTWFCGERIENPNTHGTGCTLSSAIAANLAKGYELSEAVKKGKEYITGAIGAGMNLGKGSGPVNHGFDIKSRFTL